MFHAMAEGGTLQWTPTQEHGTQLLPYPARPTHRHTHTNTLGGVWLRVSMAEVALLSVLFFFLVAIAQSCRQIGGLLEVSFLQ